MKIDAYYTFTEEQLKTFPQINDKVMIISIDSDFVENADDVISVICDEIYREYGICISSPKSVIDQTDNFSFICEELFKK